MTRINLVVEGQTEETFVREVLSRYLVNQSVVARLVRMGSGSSRSHKGGLKDYLKLRRDVLNWLKQDSTAVVTTMIDLYGLPSNFPAFAKSAALRDPYARIAALEKAFSEDVGSTRFIPYIQLHEFEALLFTDISRLKNYYPERTAEVNRLAAEAAKFESPELINDDPETAPSKRIQREIPEYDKVIAGSVVVSELKVAAICERCPHFKNWLLNLSAT
jgi:hypothetical protein